MEMCIFGAMLLGIAVFHNKTLPIAVTGLIAILIYKIGWTDFAFGSHLGHESKILINLFGLLMGFAVLAKYFEDSKVPNVVARYLPGGWQGPFTLLLLVFVMSAFLDNIAAAMIGGGIARTIFREKVHIGFLAALVAASNAGGSGSIIGDTTTTMMWIDGIAATDVLVAYIAAIPAVLFLGYFAARQQDRLQTIVIENDNTDTIQWRNIWAIVLILASAIVSNIVFDFPAGGVWIALLLSKVIANKLVWKEHLIDALPGTVFLLALVLAASMIPVDNLPLPSWQTAMGMGFVSAVFDNIPLTKLALAQGGYDWGILAYVVGYGGSMTWFGSSAGVAICNSFPEGRNVIQWIKSGWHVIVAYIIGFFIMLGVSGWNPDPPHKESNQHTQHR